MNQKQVIGIEEKQRPEDIIGVPEDKTNILRV